jgi:hypothetical protein
MLRHWSNFVHVVSFEWLLNKRPNGGDIILLRAVLIAISIYLLVVGIKHGIDPTRTASLKIQELQLEVGSTLPWFGAIFGVVYVALYARFSSQWSYLANLYNQIKAAEVAALTRLAEKKLTNVSAKEVRRKLAEWKAGYIEDAEGLHLATKKSFAPIIWFWLRDKDVRSAYIHATPGGAERCQLLIDAVKKIADGLGGIKGYNK